MSDVLTLQFIDLMRDVQAKKPGSAAAFDAWVESLAPEEREQAERDITAQVEALTADTLRTRILLDCKAAGMSPQAAGERCRAIMTYLGMAGSTFAARMSSLVTWHQEHESYRGMFTRQAMQMAWDFCEINPFGRHGFMAVVEQMAKALERMPASGKPGVVKMQAAQEGDA